MGLSFLTCGMGGVDSVSKALFLCIKSIFCSRNVLFGCSVLKYGSKHVGGEGWWAPVSGGALGLGPGCVCGSLEGGLYG